MSASVGGGGIGRGCGCVQPFWLVIAMVSLGAEAGFCEVGWFGPHQEEGAQCLGFRIVASEHSASESVSESPKCSGFS